METIPSVKEAEALVELLREFPSAAAWLSFSCKVLAAAVDNELQVAMTRDMADLYITITCVTASPQDERCVSDGRRFTEAIQVASRSKQVVGVGVNCCPPGLVTPLLASAVTQKTPDFGWVAYPNSGEGWDVESG